MSSFKISPGDSNVHPGLRTTAAGNQKSMEILPVHLESCEAKKRDSLNFSQHYQQRLDARPRARPCKYGDE